MAIITWLESQPQGTDSLGQGDDEIRSLKTAIRVGLDAEHVWPAAGGDAGVHRFGSARPFYGLQSLVSSTGSDARLYQTSDTSRLFHTGSGGTSLIGGATVISAGSYPGGAPPQRYYWAMEFGEAKIIQTTAQTITFPNSGFSGAPFTTLSVFTANARVLVNIVQQGATSFDVQGREVTGASLTSNYTVFWHSIGSRVL